MPKRGKGQKGAGAENRLEAFRLYKMGWSYREIGAQVGVTFQRVGQYIKETLDELKAEREKLGNQVIDAELEKLAFMERPLLPLTQDRTVTLKKWDAIRGEYEEETEVGPDKDAVAAVLKIQERRTRYLGLDAARKLEHDVGETLESLIAGSRAPEEKKK